MAVYHAFPYGKMNQSFKLENENDQSLYEANMLKFRLFTASDYEFVNNAAMTATVHKVGKTVSAEQGTMGLSMTTASYFKLDGRNCFDILEERGYSFKLLVKPDILHPEFALVDKVGDQVAVYKMNVPADKEEGVAAIGNKQCNTVITTDLEDIETVFLGAFIISRVDFSLYLV